ncbi:OLC1v1021151C1 [Oldenlandia corymbosa var. corymbosa]|uniref:OLC1v1021151C1 n=1 Tax=Oldenlandia corymbosa var. corymbosa TaxID=529605 RepID=A0AAV1BV22_OLDCO|nr:OLC1v1021151C1 [Oldenlandia corymbosa var. corymbosa]
MASADQSQEHADWRARQKERERERRRMRDRQRRQSMSVEEREKHLARRRKNYQLRRQRAATATAQLGFGAQTNISSEFASRTNRGIELETFTSENNLDIVCVSDVKHLQRDEAALEEMRFDEDDNGADVDIVGKTKFHSPYRYPRLPRLHQIKKLARGGLNAFASDAELTSKQAFLGNNIRLVHVKHLARALNSSVGKDCKQQFQGQEDIVSRMNDEMF